MPRHLVRQIAVALVAAYTATAPVWAQPASPSASVVEQNSTGANSTNVAINNGQITINQQDPATLAAMAKVFADQMSATAEAKAKAEAQAADLATKLGVTSSAMAEFFRILGEQNVPQDKLANRLIQIATHFRETQGELAALQPDDPHAAELAKQAQQALDAGRLSDADGLLDQAKDSELAAYRQAKQLLEKAQQAQDQHALNAAKLLASRGGVALTEFRYQDAAAAFRQAVELVPASHPEIRADYLMRQADALFSQGEFQTDETALQSAIALYRQVLQERPRDQAPLDWAKAEAGLGRALVERAKQGGFDISKQDVEEALAALVAALPVLPRDQAQVEWVRTQYLAGVVLTMLAEREDLAPARLQQAVEHLHVALEASPHDRVPIDWANIENALGIALDRLGRRELADASPTGFDHLEQAITAFRAVSQDWTREREPLVWAKEQSNICLAQVALVQRDGDARLHEAVASCRAAADAMPRERAPFEWAQARARVAALLMSQGASDNVPAQARTDDLREAVALFDGALEEITYQQAPQDWGNVILRRGAALAMLAERLDDPATADAAARQFANGIATLGDKGESVLVSDLQQGLAEARALHDRLCKAATGASGPQPCSAQ